MTGAERRVEPRWIDITTIGSEFEEQIDGNADPRAPEEQQYRHRPKAFTGEPEPEWLPGPKPW